MDKSKLRLGMRVSWDCDSGTIYNLYGGSHQEDRCVSVERDGGSIGGGGVKKSDGSATWNVLVKDLVIIEEPKYKKEETKMNKVITDNFEVTADAVLVEKWFENSIGDDSTCGVDNLLFRLHKDEILVEAKRLQAEEDKKNER